MGVRYEMPIGESYSSGELTFIGQAPTTLPTAGTVSLFVGDAIIAGGRGSGLVIVALGQALLGIKTALTNQGAGGPADYIDIRDIIDPNKKVSGDIIDATESTVWVGFRGTVLESSRSQLLDGAYTQLIATFKRHAGVFI